ncbi:hypothetical protein DRP07_04300 [Archaeoglobales archaeon]|nr:MAG: hypothetical protein DRP07_04300 [Archaeoglobales archaeon]
MMELIPEKLIRRILDNLDDVIFIADREGNIRFVTQAVESITGYRPRELTSENFIFWSILRMLIKLRSFLGNHIHIHVNLDLLEGED